MLIQKIKIDKDFINFINTCFKDIDTLFGLQHDNYEHGEYWLDTFLKAFEKFKSQEWVFDYNCSDCSFPRFKNIETEERECCQACGD